MPASSLVTVPGISAHLVTSTDIFYLVLGAAAGGFINGLAGFGTALFALGFFLVIMPPVEAVGIVLILSVCSGISGVWLVRHAIRANLPRLMRFLLPALIGIPIGVAVLNLIDAGILKITIGVFLVSYGACFGLRRSLPDIGRPTPVIDGFVGFLGGVLGGAAALSGALPTIWCSLRAWPKAEVRAVLQPFNFAVLGLSACALALRGDYTQRSLQFVLIVVPVSILSAQIGIAVFKRLTDLQFRRLLITLCLVSGLSLLARALLL